MPVIIEIETGPQRRRKSVLRSGQALEAGRGEELDFAVPCDGMMSRRHFRLTATAGGATVQDLDSTNGTFLNGQRVAEADLRDGDRVRAGNTTFVVRISVAEPPVRDRSDGAAAAAVPIPPATPLRKRTIEAVPQTSFRDPAAPLPVQVPVREEVPPGPDSSSVDAPLRSVILELVSTDAPRRRWQLKAQQTATVGSDAHADFTVEGDRTMASVHFEVVTDARTVAIRDRQSATGTYVNGHPVRSAILYHGDRIRAGQTELLVSIAGGQSPPADPGDRRGDTFILDARPDPTCRPICEPQRCPSGLTVFRGVAPEPAPARVARLLARAAGLYAIVDFGRLALPLPAELTDRSLIFEGLLPELFGESVPLLIADLEVRQLDSLLEAGWGQDALVCLLSDEPKAKVLERLRSLSRIALPLAEPAPEGAALGLCWPSVLELLLRHTPPDQSARLLESTEAYFLEADPPATWQIFAQQGFSITLAKLGFVPRQSVGSAS
jgi:pSer/pThr/pTyr-binding forkhead associated (FHA) protein